MRLRHVFDREICRDKRFQERANIDLAHDMGEDPISEFSQAELLVLIHIRIGGIMMKNKMLAIIVITVAGGLGGGLLTFAIGLPSSPCGGIIGITHSFTIIVKLNRHKDRAYPPRTRLPHPLPGVSLRCCAMGG